MAVSNAMFGMGLAMIATFFFLIKNEIRLWRMVGSVALVVLGVSLVFIEDSVPMYLLFSICAIIAGITLFNDVSKLVK